MITLHIFFGIMIIVGTIMSAVSFQGDTSKLTKLRKFSLVFTTSAIGLAVIAVVSIASSIYIGLVLLIALGLYEYFAFLRKFS